MMLVENRPEALFAGSLRYEANPLFPVPRLHIKNDDLKIPEKSLSDERDEISDDQDVNEERFVSDDEFRLRFLQRALTCAELREPVLCEEGEGGTYFVMDENNLEPIAVFKPNDEEPFSPNNPKLKNSMGSNNAEMKKGIRVGESALREVAAYLLDQNHFVGVPFTTIVTFKSKTGSLQAYIPHECQSWDLGPSKFNTSDVHKIGVLDIRLFNVDRHGGNILVKRLPNGETKLVPIDHGFSLPDSLDATDLWFEWLSWPQAKIPFDSEMQSYIQKLDVNSDAMLLRNLGIREECVRTMIISSTLLKRAACRGFSLFQIASMVCRKVNSRRKNFAGKTPLEIINEQIPQRSHSKFFLDWVETQVNNFLDRLEMHQQAIKTFKNDRRNSSTSLGALERNKQNGENVIHRNHRKNQSSVSSLAIFTQQRNDNQDFTSLRRSVSSSNLSNEIYLQNLVDQRLISGAQPSNSNTCILDQDGNSPTAGLRRAFSNCALSEL